LTTEELAVASRQRTVSHFLFHQKFFSKRNMIAVPHPHCSSLFPRLKQPSGRNFDTVQVIEANSQAVLKDLTEHDFQDAFKK
jgi:hypothetical protein